MCEGGVLRKKDVGCSICSRALLLSMPYHHREQKPTIFVKTSRGRILFRNTYEVRGVRWVTRRKERDRQEKYTPTLRESTYIL